MDRFSPRRRMSPLPFHRLAGAAVGRTWEPEPTLSPPLPPAGPGDSVSPQHPAWSRGCHSCLCRDKLQLRGRVTPLLPHLKPSSGSHPAWRKVQVPSRAREDPQDPCPPLNTPLAAWVSPEDTP